MARAVASNGARTIIVENANRFARDLMVQEVGFAMLRDLGITLIAADSPTSFLDDGPTSKLIRQIEASKQFGELVDVRRVTDPNGLVRKYLAKERTPQAGYAASMFWVVESRDRIPLRVVATACASPANWNATPSKRATSSFGGTAMRCAHQNGNLIGCVV